MLLTRQPNRRALPQGLAIATQSAEFWRRLAPELTISGPNPAITNQPADRAHQLWLVNDGYLCVKRSDETDTHARLAKVVDRIASAGLPPAFIGVYDEVWQIIAALNPVLDTLFDGKAALVPNFWAHHSGSNTPGLTADRRRPGAGVYRDGTPKNVTVWVPLTDATPGNGCVYLVPAGQDRNYGRSASSRADASLSGIRALPVSAGEALIWTGETYHWQARPDRYQDDGPLMSLTWEFQCRDLSPLEGTLIDSYPRVPFETRLAILARQMPKHSDELSKNPVWGAVQQTLSNRYPLRAAG
jgi:phytanoyl-CoA dioxygenase PhyH